MKPTPKIGDHITIRAIEAAHIKAVLCSCITLEAAAAVLGIEPSTLWRKRIKLGLIEGPEVDTARG